METEKKKLTEKQLKIVQFVAGVLAAIAMIAAISISGMPFAEGNIILQYLFLIVFLVVMFGRRWVENKYRLRLNLFSLVLIDGILAGIIGYVIWIFYYPVEGAEVALAKEWKLVIVIGLVVAFLVLGLGLPIFKYFKRKEAGTLRPVRLPEETEEEGENKGGGRPGRYQQYQGKSISQQLAEMSDELNNEEKEEDK